ncbi:unnamed protein product, partial [Polarella glacialis]
AVAPTAVLKAARGAQDEVEDEWPSERDLVWTPGAATSGGAPAMFGAAEPEAPGGLAAQRPLSCGGGSCASTSPAPSPPMPESQNVAKGCQAENHTPRPSSEDERLAPRPTPVLHQEDDRESGWNGPVAIERSDGPRPPLTGLLTWGSPRASLPLSPGVLPPPTSASSAPEQGEQATASNSARACPSSTPRRSPKLESARRHLRAALQSLEACDVQVQGHLEGYAIPAEEAKQ